MRNALDARGAAEAGGSLQHDVCVGAVLQAHVHCQQRHARLQRPHVQVRHPQRARDLQAEEGGILTAGLRVSR